MENLCLIYDKNDWLHVKNQYFPIVVCYAKNVKESYDVVKELLGLLKYDEELWKVCWDFKVYTFFIHTLF